MATKINLAPIQLETNAEEWREEVRRAIAMFRDLRSVSCDENPLPRRLWGWQTARKCGLRSPTWDHQHAE